MSKLVSIAIVLFVITGFSRIGGLSLVALIDVPSLVFIVGVVFGGVLFSFGPAMALRVFVPFRVREVCEDETHRELLARALVRATSLSYAAAVLGLMIGVITILGNWSENVHAGSGLAVALVCPFYSVLLSTLLFDGVRATLDNPAKLQEAS